MITQIKGVLSEERLKSLFGLSEEYYLTDAKFNIETNQVECIYTKDEE